MTRSGGMRGLITWVSVRGLHWNHDGDVSETVEAQLRRILSENSENSQGAAGNCSHAPAHTRKGHENA